MINQLINCRANYIELAYSQMIQQVFIQSHQNTHTIVRSDSELRSIATLIKETSSILSWLHYNLSNEVQILECSALDQYKYVEVLNTIFGERLPQRVLFRI